MYIYEACCLERIVPQSKLLEHSASRHGGLCPSRKPTVGKKVAIALEYRLRKLQQKEKSAATEAHVMSSYNISSTCIEAFGYNSPNLSCSFDSR
jgi:hypothetical protein